VDSWWRWLVWHCSYCLCKCDQQGPDSDRYFSLKPVTSAVAENRVVTGVRLAKRGRVIQLEIEEADAEPEGAVDEDSRAWRRPEAISADPADADPADVMTLSYEQRALDTDRLEAPPGHVITGVRFRNIGGHLNLEAHITPIKFSDGKLVADRSTWIGNDNTPLSDNPRRKVDILMPDVPTRAVSSSKIDTRHNEYVVFDATAANKDVRLDFLPI